MEIIGFILTAMVVLIILKILLVPAKIILKIGVNIVVGGILLGLCFALGIGIVVYWWTIALTAVLGIPGFFISLIITILI